MHTRVDVGAEEIHRRRTPLLRDGLHLITRFAFGRRAFLLHHSFGCMYWYAKSQLNTYLYIYTFIVEIELFVPQLVVLFFISSTIILTQVSYPWSFL
jgi:hypothetical protein